MGIGEGQESDGKDKRDTRFKRDRLECWNRGDATDGWDTRNARDR